MTHSPSAKVKPFPYSHCHQCGAPYMDASFPRKCTKCNDMRWHNPTGIGVMLQTVTDGTRIGILVPVRGHQPQLGCKGLVGGFEEAFDDGVADAAMREYREEIHRDGDIRREDLIILESRGSGPMYPPGRRQSLTFSVNPVPIHVDAFADWTPDAETTAIEFAWEPRVLAFPTHTLALALYFQKHQGVTPPPQYLDQPLVGDNAVYDGVAYPVFNVPYDQPMLDEGGWQVQLEQDGVPVTVFRNDSYWSIQHLGEDAVPYLMPDREDVERLKRKWIEDPHWDIEDTEGFEAVRAELAAFADIHRRRQEQAAIDRVNTRAAELGCSPQLAKYVMALESRIGMIETLNGIQGH